jgi:hypothetical protein
MLAAGKGRVTPLKPSGDRSSYASSPGLRRLRYVRSRHSDVPATHAAVRLLVGDGVGAYSRLVDYLAGGDSVIRGAFRMCGFA